jgi:Uma2 family endonuclease
MASLPNTKTVSYEEWLRMPEVDDQIEEVVNGEIRLMPPPSGRQRGRFCAAMALSAVIVLAALEERRTTAIDERKYRIYFDS